MNKYILKFTEYLLDSPIFEMAYHRKVASERVRNMSYTLFEHIIKYKYLNDDRNKKHWKNEILSFISKINLTRIKPFNRNFSQGEYMEYLFIEPFCLSESSYKLDKYITNENYIKPLLSDINRRYSSKLRFEDIDFNELVILYKDICEHLSGEDINIEDFL